MTRRRRLDAPPGKVWHVVSDPYHLPRWWPRTQRVENVTEGGGDRGRKWTQVLETRDGRAIRADYRCVGAATAKHYTYEQLVEGTPFEGFLVERDHGHPPGAGGRRHRGDAAEPPAPRASPAWAGS